MNKTLYFIILALIFCGCATVANFESVRNNDVGCSIDSIWIKDARVTSYNQTQDEYLFERDDGCKWAYYVNKKTKKIESWKHISSPDKCRTGVNWIGPW